MIGVKTMLASRGVWGGLVVLASWGLAAAGYAVSESDQKTLVEIVAGVASSDAGAAAIAMALANAAGALLAIYGRVKATKRIN